MGKVLSASAVDRYRRDGYLFPLRALSAVEAREHRARLEAWEAANGPLKGSHRHKSHLLFAWLADLIRHPAILDPVEDLIGPDILCWSTSFFTKDARTEDYVSWHQDATYWGLSEPDIVTAWVAFSPSTRESGSMRVVPGSHARQVPHVDTFREHNLLTRGQEIAVEVNESEAVDIVLEPGQMSLHHVLLFHASNPNRSGDRRIGFAIRYLPTRVRQVAGPRDSATLVRGTDAHGHFDLEPRPDRDWDPEFVALHQAISDRQAKILYRGTDRTNY